MSRTEIFGHRGASGYAPENTLEAFALAVEQKADGVELDVQLSKDGELVVIHDETLDRTTNGTGLVMNYTLEELKTFTVSANGPERYPNAKIPTLREVLELMKQTGTKVNIELKTGEIWYPDIEKKTVALVKELGMEDKIIYSSFNHYSVMAVKEIDPEAETAFLLGHVPLDVEKQAREMDVQGLHPGTVHMHMPSVRKAYLDSGLNLRVWTVNEEEDMRDLIGAGIKAVISNYPDRAFKIREETESR
ncbi:MAG: glycerophosphodiester phosphodiesterase [Clostridiales bacterium]|nr:glycerophosphodiester phosphodiesterase [Clostridiales bacterium]